MAKKTAKNTAAKKKSVNYPGAQPPTGAPFNDQDEQRRLGNFTGAGEAPRKGGRHGIGTEKKAK